MITQQLNGIYNGEEIILYTLSSNNISVDILSFGGTVSAIRVLDKNGNITDVALGHKSVDEILKYKCYIGSTVGRVANRISGGKFTFNKKEYNVSINDNNKNSLHGGVNGVSFKNMKGKIENNSLFLSTTCFDGEDGYPSNLFFTVKFTVENNALNIEYFIKADGESVINPTSHIYFNLNGENKENIENHYLTLRADKFLPIDKYSIPTGEVRNVKNTPFDFTNEKQIGKDINKLDEQLILANGYDQNFILSDKHFATAYSPTTQIQLDAYTDRISFQLYTGNFLDNCVGKSVYNKRAGFCLETQNITDCVNNHLSEIEYVDKDRDFYSKTTYKFSIKK